MELTLSINNKLITRPMSHPKMNYTTSTMIKRAMQRFFLLSSGLSAILLTSTAPAQAVTWTFSWTGGLSGGFNGTLTSSDTPDTNGYYSITGISGFIGGNPSNLLPQGTTSADGVTSDNLITVNSPNLTSRGFTFSDNGNGDGTIDVRYETGTTPGYYEITNFGTYALSNVSFSSNIPPVPMEIPGGEASVALGTVLAIGVMRKARKFTSNRPS
jgi:hypothetical protein